MHTHYENLQPTGNLIFCLKITVETSVYEATSSAFSFKNIISMKGRVKILKIRSGLSSESGIKSALALERRHSSEVQGQFVQVWWFPMAWNLLTVFSISLT